MGERLGSFDVVVVGGGLAGGSLALRLARRGVKVALIEAWPLPREKLCGEYLSPEGVAALRRLGLGTELDRLATTPIRRVRLTTPRGRVLEAELRSPRDHPALGLSRAVLDEMLVRAAQSQGAVLHEAERACRPLISDDRVVGVVTRDRAGREVEVRARSTVAADGRHSSLARATGTLRYRFGSRHKSFGLKRHVRVADASRDEPTDSVGLHLFPSAYVGTCRIQDGITNVCGLLPESTASRHRGNLDDLASTCFRENPYLRALWEASVPVDEWKTVANVRIQSTSASLPGILSVGDARGTVDPLGGQGMTMALLGAQLAEHHILDHLLSPPSDRDLRWVREYERAWHARFDGRIRLCRMFHQMLVRPVTVDLATLLGRAGTFLLALGYRCTRDPLE